MKRLLIEQEKEKMLVTYLNDLKGGEIVVYRSKTNTTSKPTYCMLVKCGFNELNGSERIRYGFAPMHDSNGRIRFAESSWSASIRAAGASRELIVFNSLKELCKAIIEEKI